MAEISASLPRPTPRLPTLWRWLATLCLFQGLAFAVYGRALQNAFVFDDETQITGNVTIHDWHGIPELFLTSTNQLSGSAKLAGIYYKPAMTTAYVLLWAIDGSNPSVFHAAEIALHALCAWLLFLLLARFAPWPAALALALIYLVHPLNAEIAIYAADLQDALYIAFGLGALLVATADRAWTAARAMALAALLLLALLSKESGILFWLATGAWLALFPQAPASPANAPALGATVADGQNWRGRGRSRKRGQRAGAAGPPASPVARGSQAASQTRAGLAWGALAAVAIAYAVLRFGAAGLWASVGNSWAHMGHATLLERLPSIPLILFHYFALFAWPDRLIAAQDWMVRELSLREFWAPAVADLALAAALWACYRLLNLGRAGLFFIFLLGCGLALHAQLVPLDGTVADRWFCAPMIALLGVAALVAQKLASLDGNAGRYSAKLSGKPPEKSPIMPLSARATRVAAIALAAVALMALAARSMARVEDWRDGMSLYAHDLALDPENGLLQNNFGVEEYRRGHGAEALACFAKAVRLSPHWTIPWNNYGAALEAFSRLPEAEAAYRNSVELGLYDLAFENYPRLLVKMGKRAEAILFIETTALPALPKNPTLLALKAQLSRAP